VSNNYHLTPSARPFVRTAALAAILGTLVSLAISVLITARVIHDDASIVTNVLDLVGDIPMILGLVSYVNNPVPPTAGSADQPAPRAVSPIVSPRMTPS
jgi:hypothetical protein